MRRIPSLYEAVGRGLVLAILALGLVASSPAGATISGFVREDGTNAPIVGARVHVRADPSSPVAITQADGSFTLPIAPADPVALTAAVTYDRAAAVNWQVAGNTAINGQTNVEILLPRLEPTTAVGYEPPPAVAGCANCHFEKFQDWSTSSHALAGTDVWVRDVHSGDGTPGGSAGYVFLDTHDPGETGFCATCHTPIEDALLGGPNGLQLNQASTPAGLDGVTCLACHQIDSVNDNFGALHHRGNATYRWPAETSFPTWMQVWGPLDDVDYGLMRTSHSPLFADSRLCASCHQYNNPINGGPGQNTYNEWLASSYATPGPGFRTCQSCHMPQASGPGTICEVANVIRPAQQRHAHTFLGAGAPELAGAIDLRAAGSELPGAVRVIAEVENLGAGHSWPTGVSIRNAILHVTATLNGVPLARLSGPTIPYWADDAVPGKQPGDLADEPGTGFAEVLEGRINQQGPVVRPVLFIDADAVAEQSSIEAGATSTSDLQFALPPGAQAGDVVEVEARLLYRRAWRALYIVKNWTVTPQGGPVEREVAVQRLPVRLTPASVGGIVEVPALRPVALVALAAALGAAGLAALRRRRHGRPV